MTSFEYRVYFSMNTFLPYPDYRESAVCLDKVRLNKQITECYQLLNGNWSNHPAAKMWKGYERALVWYARECYWEFIKRGGTKTHKSWWTIHSRYGHPYWAEFPPWDNGPIHSNHRGRLLHKGNLDVISKQIHHLKRKPDEYLLSMFGKKLKLRNLTVDQASKLSDLLSSQAPAYDNWYEQFGWKEKPTDENFWPI